MKVKALIHNDETMVSRTTLYSKLFDYIDYCCKDDFDWESTLFRPTPESIILQVESKMRAQTKPIPYLLGPKEMSTSASSSKICGWKIVKIGV
jgi:hypothetical protein